jgi:Alpha-N-acetylglucosaminidase (NAGLU) N-terminal domain
MLQHINVAVFINLIKMPSVKNTNHICKSWPNNYNYSKNITFPFQTVKRYQHQKVSNSNFCNMRWLPFSNNIYRKLYLLFIVGLLAFQSSKIAAQLNVQASYALIKRTIPQHASSFIVERLSQQNGKDVFEIESKNNKIILRGKTV